MQMRIEQRILTRPVIRGAKVMFDMARGVCRWARGG